VKNPTQKLVKVVEKMDYKEIFEKEFERIINQKIDEVMENYEKTLYEELSTLALNINSIRAIAILTHIIDINYKPTNWVYAIYRKLCDAMKADRPPLFGEFDR
jgi:hypothetical protein